MLASSDIEYAFETAIALPNAVDVEWITKQGSSNRLFRQTRCKQSVRCDDCHEVHRAWKMPSGAYEVSCSAGMRIIAAHELERWVLKREELLKLLIDGLALSGRMEMRCTDTFWYLGEYAFNGSRMPVWLARQCGDAQTLTMITQSLDKRSPAESGVIIASSSIAESLLWPRASNTIRLSDLLLINDLCISVDCRILNSAMPVGSSGSNTVGRPSKSDVKYAAEFLSRARNNEAMREGVGKEAEAVRKLICDRVGAANTCVQSTIESAIRKPYNAWKAANYDARIAFPDNSELVG